jgi:hypothetical protein
MRTCNKTTNTLSTALSMIRSYTMPVSKTETTAARPARRSAQSWTLDLAPEEEKGTLNVRVPKSVIDDIELLRSQFDSTAQVVVERCLKFALSSNRELQELKAKQQHAEATTPAAKA